MCVVHCLALGDQRGMHCGNGRVGRTGSPLDPNSWQPVPGTPSKLCCHTEICNEAEGVPLTYELAVLAKIQTYPALMLMRVTLSWRASDCAEHTTCTVLN